MSDDELIDRVARMWIACGGDADGVAWCWRRLQERVAQLQAIQQEHKIEHEERGMKT